MFFLKPKSSANSESDKAMKKFLKLGALSLALILVLRGITKFMRDEF